MKKLPFTLFAVLATMLILNVSAFAKKAPSLKDAIMNQDIAKMKELFEQGADANEQMTSEPAIHWAVIVGNCDMIKLLVEKGADVNDSRGIYPIIWSVFRAETPAELLQKNKDNNALILKRCKGDADKAAQWMKHEDITRFSTAEEKLKLLLELGANPNEYVSGGEQTFVTEAVKKRNLNLLQVVIDSKKADLELRYHQGVEKQLKVVEAIHTFHYMDKDNPGNYKVAVDWISAPQFKTPLLYAVDKNDLELVKILVEGGAELINGMKKEVPDVKGGREFYFEGPLDLAIHEGYTEIADYLKSKGAFRMNNQ